MTTTKRASKKKQGEVRPTASRPHIPGYGIPKDKAGLIEIMKDRARYVKIVEWAEEDRCFVGNSPGLIYGGCPKS